MRRQRGRIGLVAAALLGLVASGARADVTTERSASLLVFPNVIANGKQDTIIQITNTSNSMVHLHCFYVNGALTIPELPPSPINPPLWQEIDFDIWLTKQQPTHWVVSQGRPIDPFDPPCNPGNFACNGAGIDPGRIPPVVPDFTGELKCIEVDAAGAPLSGNHLKGEATLVQLNTCVESICQITGAECISNEDCMTGTIPPKVEGEGEGAGDLRIEAIWDLAKYNALGVIGNENNNGDNVLCLGGGSSGDCPFGAEYNACPEFWLLNHYADFAPDPVADDGFVTTEITVVPCTQNFETQDPETVVIFMRVFNEFEQEFSAFLTVTCWDTVFLHEIDGVLTFPVLGTPFATTRMRPTAQTASGFFMVAKEFHQLVDNNHGNGGGAGNGSGRGFRSVAAYNVHTEGERPGPDLWVIPSDQVPSP